MKISTKGRYALRLMLDIAEHSEGYLLKKKPEEYTVGMILRLTEGSLAPVACVEDDAEPCERMTGCATVRVWQKINDAVKDVVDNITLADLVQWQLEENQTNDYCI